MKQLKRLIPTITVYAFRMIILSFLLVNSLFAQQDRYARKSITFVDYLVYRGEQSRMSIDVESRFLSTIQRQIHLDRFDINRVPENISNRLRVTINNIVSVDDEIINEALEDILLPEVQKILDVEKEVRARTFLNEAERNSFIALKAKEYGVSSEHMLEVMNSAYIFLPFISDIKAKKHYADDDDDEDEMRVTVDGGLIIYKINYQGDYSIEKMTEIFCTSYASHEKNGSWRKAREKAFVETAGTMAMNLKLEIQKIEDFKLKTQLRKVKGLHVRFPLGEREGLKLDRPYYVGEWRETEKGKRYFKEDGFVRIRAVADNYDDPDALSSAYIIHKGDWARGMTLVEHPTLGIDLAFKPRVFQADVDSGYFFAEEEEMAMAMGSTSSQLFGMDFDLNINIAEQTRKLQSFLVIGGTISFLPIESRTFDKDRNYEKYMNNLDKNVGFFFNGYMGYLRKNYIGPLAFRRELLLGIQGLTMGADFDGDNYSLSAVGFGGRVNLGLEIAVNIDCNIGIIAGYNYFPGLSIWSAKMDDEDVDLDTWRHTKYPKISSVGPTFGLYLHYSLPSLGGSSAKLIGSAGEVLRDSMLGMLD